MPQHLPMNIFLWLVCSPLLVVSSYLCFWVFVLILGLHFSNLGPLSILSWFLYMVRGVDLIPSFCPSSDSVLGARQLFISGVGREIVLYTVRCLTTFLAPLLNGCNTLSCTVTGFMGRGGGLKPLETNVYCTKLYNFSHCSEQICHFIYSMRNLQKLTDFSPTPPSCYFLPYFTNTRLFKKFIEIHIIFHFFQELFEALLHICCKPHDILLLLLLLNIIL